MILCRSPPENEADPVTGAKWVPLKTPRPNSTTGPILQYRNHLQDSRGRVESADGVVYGTNLVYGAVHQHGYSKNNIPARPYMGVPANFGRRILEDPAVQRLL